MKEVGECSAASVDIDDMVISINQRLHYYCSLRHVHSCLLNSIYRVEDHVRSIDSNAYQPIIVSIGPYHHGIAELSSMERKKWNCVDFVIKSNCGKGLEDYLNVLKEKEDAAKSYYSEDIKMDEAEFLQMLLLDGCFLLVTLGGMEGMIRSSGLLQREGTSNQEIIQTKDSKDVGVAFDDKSQGNNTLQDTIGEYSECMEHGKYQDETQRLGPWYTNFISHDLLLLENQIPFFIIKEIFQIVTEGSMETTFLTDHIADCIENFVPFYSRGIQESHGQKSFHHLLHLCHMYFRPSENLGQGHMKFGFQPEDDEEKSLLNQQQQRTRACQRLNHWRGALQYYETGIEFKKKPPDRQRPHSQLDITFHNGVVEIPCLIVDQNTNPLFRNLIAFEQKCPQFGNDFTSYIFFMSQIMSSPNDVTLLARKGIVVHEMRTDEEVSSLFAKLEKNVDFDLNRGCYLTNLCSAMEEHYQRRLNRWIAWLRQNHFRNPWLTLAVVAAVIVVICTLLQSLFAYLAYLNQT